MCLSQAAAQKRMRQKHDNARNSRTTNTANNGDTCEHRESCASHEIRARRATRSGLVVACSVVVLVNAGNGSNSSSCSGGGITVVAATGGSLCVSTGCCVSTSHPLPACKRSRFCSNLHTSRDSQAPCGAGAGLEGVPRCEADLLLAGTVLRLLCRFGVLEPLGESLGLDRENVGRREHRTPPPFLQGKKHTS